MELSGENLSSCESEATDSWGRMTVERDKGLVVIQL